MDGRPSVPCPQGCRQSDTPERESTTALISIKAGTVSHGAERSSWVPLPPCSPPPGSAPVPMKPLAFSTCVSSDSSVSERREKSPPLRPWGRRPPVSCTAAALPCWPQPREAGGEGNVGTQLPGAGARAGEAAILVSLPAQLQPEPPACPVPLAVPRFCLQDPAHLEG